MFPYTGDWHGYGTSWGKDILRCWNLFREDLIYLAIRFCIDNCWYSHFIIINTYRFISKLYWGFVHYFYILLYVKEIVFTCAIYSTTVYPLPEHDILGFACTESCCDMVRVIHTCFVVFENIVMHISSCLE